MEGYDREEGMAVSSPSLYSICIEHDFYSEITEIDNASTRHEIHQCNMQLLIGQCYTEIVGRWLYFSLLFKDRMVVEGRLS